MRLKVNILVLNYNGRGLLKKYLPSLELAVGRSRHDARLGVVDNCSVDGSLEYLASAFPRVGVYRAAENRVLCSYNDVARSVDDDILILMNNDIRVDENFVDSLVEPLIGDPTVFFVTPRCLAMVGGAYEGNKTRGTLRYGVYWSSAVYPGYEREIDRPGPTLSGGFGAFRRTFFLELGGYDDLYLPGRLEDSDICFRAWKKGWKCLYEPRSVVYHEGGTSFHKVFGVRKTLVINWRNTILFMAKNLSGVGTWVRFLFWLPARVGVALLRGRPEFVWGLGAALRGLPRAWARRPKRVPGEPSDAEIFSKV